MRVAYLGPPGTFSEEAVSRCDLAAGTEPLPCASFQAAWDAVLAGEADAALLPVENSIEGAIGTTLDLLVHRPGLLIRREVQEAGPAGRPACSAFARAISACNESPSTSSIAM